MSDGADRTRAILGSASGLLGTALMFYGTRKWSRYSDAPKPKNELPLPGGKSAPASRTASQDPKPRSRRNSSTSRRSASALSFQPSRGTSRSRATTVEPSPVPADDAPEDVATASLVSTARATVIVDPESEGDEVTSSPPLTAFSGILKKYEGPSNATTKSSSPPLQMSLAPVEATPMPLQVSSTPEEVCTPLQVSPSPVDVSTQVSPVPEEVVDEVVSYDGHDDFFWSAYRRVDADNKRVGALSMLVTSLVVDEESFQRHSIETDALRWYIDGEGYKVHSGMFLRKIEQLQKRRRTAEKEDILQRKEAALASSERSLEEKRANLDGITSNMLREYHSSVERFQQMDLQRSEDEDRLIYATSDATSCSDGMRQFLCVWQQAAFDREEEASRTTIEQESLSTRLAIRSSFQSGLLSLDRLQYKLQYHAFLDDAKRHQEEKNREFEAVRAQILQSEQDKLRQLDLSIEAIKKEGGARQQSVLEALQSAADHETRFVSDATGLFSEWRTAIQEETSRDRQDREERAESARDDKSRHRQLEDRMSDALSIIASLQGELEVLQRQREADAAARLNPTVAPTPTTTVTTIPARVSLVAASTQSDDVQLHQMDNSPSRGRRPTSPFSSTVTPTATSTSNKRTQTGVEEEEVAEESLSYMMRIPTPITSELFNVFELQGPPLPEGWTLLTPSFYVGGSSIKCAGEAIISTNIEGVSVVVNAKELEFEDNLTVEAFADQRIKRMKDGAPDANIEVQSQGPAITVLERTDFEWFVSFTTGADTPSSRTNMALFAIFDNVGYYVTLSSPTNLYEEVVTIFTAFMSSVRIVANPRRARRGHRRATTIRYASKDNPNHTVDIPLRWRPLAGQNDFPMHFALGLNASPQENVAIRLDSETGKVRLSSWKELPMDIARRVISSARVRDAPATSPRMFVHHSVQFPLPPNNDCLITEHKIGFYEVSLLVALAPSTAAKTPFCNDLSDGAPKAIVRVAIIESPEVDLVKRLVLSISKRSPELVRNLEKHNTSQKKFVYAGPTKRPHVKINEATTTILFAVERAPERWVLFHAEFPQHHVKVIAQYLIKAAAQCELFTPFVTDEAGDSMYESPSRSLSARELAARYSFRKVKSESTISTV